MSTPVDGLNLQGTTFTFAIPALRGTYGGTVAADGNSIIGTWNQGRPLPLTFVRATAETAWKDQRRTCALAARGEECAIDVDMELLLTLTSAGSSLYLWLRILRRPGGQIAKSWESLPVAQAARRFRCRSFYKICN
jgi:hypothetical protein